MMPAMLLCPRKTPHRVLERCLASVLFWAATGAAAAEAPSATPSETPSEAEHWIPALGVSSGAFIQKSDASVDSTLRGFFNDHVLSVYPLVEGNLELMSPALLDGPIQPRLFVRGGVGRSWDALHRVPKEGDAGALVVPVFLSGNDPPLEAVKGQGSETRLQTNPFYYTASAGLALSMPFDEDRALRLKSSIEYRYGATEIEAVISMAQSIADDDICPCRLGRVAATEQEAQHALGVGLEVELDVVRIGPTLMAVHAGAQALRLLDGRKLRVSAQGRFDDGITPLDVMSQAELEPWTFRLALGIRFRWFPD